MPLKPASRHYCSDCPVCRGKGTIDETTVCPACFGDGHVAGRNEHGSPYKVLGQAVFLPELLRSAIEVCAADFGNIQLFDSSGQALRIVAQHGFGREFLRFFAIVRDQEAACGTAMRLRSRMIVTEVSSDPIFKGSRAGEVVLRANVNAVQSTPLIEASGQLLGVLSTHYRRPGGPSRRELQELDRVIAPYKRIMEEWLGRAVQGNG